MHYSSHFAYLVCGLMVLGMVSAVRADSIIFTADVPNGTLNFDSEVQFRVWNSDNQSPVFVTDTSPGQTGNNVVSSMKLDMDAFANSFSGKGSVSGEDLTVATASDGWYTAPGEVGMSIAVDHMGGSLPPGAVPDLPLTYELPDIPGIGVGLIILFLADSNGQPVAMGGNGSLVATVGLDGSSAPIVATASFSASDTTTDILSVLDDVFSSAVLPLGAHYHGLQRGFPVFSTNDRRDLMAGFSINSTSQLNFLTGAAIYSIPEPSTVVLLACAVPLALLWHRRRLRCRQHTDT